MPLAMFKLVRKSRPPAYLWAREGLDWLWLRYRDGDGRVPWEAEGLDFMGETVTVPGADIEAVECLGPTAAAD